MSTTRVCPEIDALHAGSDATSVTANVVNATTRVTAGTDIRAPRYYDSDNTGYYVDPASTSRLNYVSLDSAQLNTVVSEGAGCSPNGRIARASAGTLLYCESGVWTSGGGVTGSVSATGWTRLGNGLLMQWGRVLVGAEGCATFGFPTGFSSVFSVVSTPVGSNNGGGKEDFWGVQSVTGSSVQVCSKYDNDKYGYVYAVGR